MASESRTSIMVYKVENGKNGDEAMETEHLLQHVSKTNDSDEEYHEPGMRVGDDFQAAIPKILTENKEEAKHDPTLRHNALLVWAPVGEVQDGKLDNYVQQAKDKHGYNAEQALGMLFWHKHNVDRSLDDLANFTPFPDEWSMEDKVLFEQAFGSHGKSFRRIQQTLPDKTVSSLVKYYYSWKKTRSRTSLIDRQAKKLAYQKDQFINGSLHMAGSKRKPRDSGDSGDSGDSDFEPEREGRQSNGQPKIKNIAAPKQAPGQNISGACMNCGTQCQQLHPTQRGNMCSACYQFYRRTGTLRPRTGGREERLGSRGGRMKRKPPKVKGMILSQDYLTAVSGTQGDSHVRPLEIEIVNLKRQIQANKQAISQQKYQKDGIENFRPEDPNDKNNSRWSNEELLLAVQSVRKYGRNFQAMAEVLGNKTVSQCRNFFVNYRRRFNLLQVLDEYDAEQGITSSDRRDDDLQVTISPGDSGGSSPDLRQSPPLSQGHGNQPPPLLKPSGPQSQRPPPIQAPGLPPRSQVGGLGPPPLIKPATRVPLQPQPVRPQGGPPTLKQSMSPPHLIHQQMMEQKHQGGPVGMQPRSDSPHSGSGTPPSRQTRSAMQ